MSELKLTKVMCIDDELGLLEVYKDILTPFKTNVALSGLDTLSALLDDNYEDLILSNNNDSTELLNFDVLCFNKGSEAIVEFEKIFLDEKSDNIGVCIVDMRMPNDLNGLDTAIRLKEIDPNINIIIATAYSDKKPQDFIKYLKNNIYYMKKPTDTDELYQLTYSLSFNYQQKMELIDAHKQVEISNNSLASLVTTIENFIYADGFNTQTLQVVLDKTKEKRLADYKMNCIQEDFWF